MRILHYGEQPLRIKSVPVAIIDNEIKTLIKNMFETMYAANGVGLAAPQVGVNKRIFVIDLDNQHPMVFINPQIIKSVGKEISEEGCLSFPGLRELVPRAKKVVVKALDIDGREFEIEGEGLFARAIQHELDHLDGVLFIDRISKARKIQIRKELEKIAAGESLEEEVSRKVAI